MNSWDAKLEHFKDVKYFRLFEGLVTLTLNGRILLWKEDTYLWKAVIQLFYLKEEPYHKLISKRDAFTLIKLRYCKALRKRWGFFRKLLTMTKTKGKKRLREEVDKYYILEKLR